MLGSVFYPIVSHSWKSPPPPFPPPSPAASIENLNWDSQCWLAGAPPPSPEIGPLHNRTGHSTTGRANPQPKGAIPPRLPRERSFPQPDGPLHNRTGHSTTTALRLTRMSPNTRTLFVISSGIYIHIYIYIYIYIYIHAYFEIQKHIIPQTVFSCRGSHSLVLRGIGPSSAT